MAIVVPSAESVKSPAFPLTEKQRIVAQTLLEVLEAHPRSRILLWATVFILQAIGIPQRSQKGPRICAQTRASPLPTRVYRIVSHPQSYNPPCFWFHSQFQVA